jgi:hypothetical protein
MASINYVPQFQHQDWIDNQDRVAAGGANGFNGRFHALEAEFKRISDVVTLLSSAIDGLGVKPPPSAFQLSLSPTLSPTSTQAWVLVNGIALKQAGQISAHGMLAVQLPHGATVQSLRATGRNADAALANPGSGNLRVVLARNSITADPQPTQILAQVNGSGVIFDTTVPVSNTFAVVDNSKFRYFINADVDNAGVNDNVQLNAFQVTILPAA